MSRWAPYLQVGLGSALGGTCRMLAGVVVNASIASPFPWATLIVNVLGSWLIARLATHAVLNSSGRIARAHGLLIAGFCGGFTTFSLFSLETVQLAVDGQYGLAALYVGVSVPLWLGAAWWGDRAARRSQARS